MQLFLRNASAGHIVKHQDNPDDLPFTIPDRRGTVFDRVFLAVFGNKDRMVGASDHHSLGQHASHGVFSGTSRLLILNMKNLG